MHRVALPPPLPIQVKWGFMIIHYYSIHVASLLETGGRGGGDLVLKPCLKDPSDRTCHETQLCTHGMLGKKLSPLKCISLSRETEIFALQL